MKDRDRQEVERMIAGAIGLHDKAKHTSIDVRLKFLEGFVKGLGDGVVAGQKAKAEAQPFRLDAGAMCAGCMKGWSKHLSADEMAKCAPKPKLEKCPTCGEEFSHTALEGTVSNGRISISRITGYHCDRCGTETEVDRKTITKQGKTPEPLRVGQWVRFEYGIGTSETGVPETAYGFGALVSHIGGDWWTVAVRGGNLGVKHVEPALAYDRNHTPLWEGDVCQTPSGGCGCHVVPNGNYAGMILLKRKERA